MRDIHENAGHDEQKEVPPDWRAAQPQHEKHDEECPHHDKRLQHTHHQADNGVAVALPKAPDGGVVNHLHQGKEPA